MPMPIFRIWKKISEHPLPSRKQLKLNRFYQGQVRLLNLLHLILRKPQLQKVGNISGNTLNYFLVADGDTQQDNYDLRRFLDGDNNYYQHSPRNSTLLGDGQIG